MDQKNRIYFKVLNLLNIRSRAWISVDRRPFNRIWTIWYDREITSNPMQFIVFSVQLIHLPVKFRFKRLELIDYRPQPLLYKTKSWLLRTLLCLSRLKQHLKAKNKDTWPSYSQVLLVKVMPGNLDGEERFQKSNCN